MSSLPGPLSPPIDTRDPRVHNLVVGFGNLGESIVHQLIKIAHFADERAVMITIIEKDPVKVGRFHHFMSRFQNLTKVAEFNLVQEDPLAVTADMWAAQANNSHLYCIYICLNLDQVRARANAEIVSGERGNGSGMEKKRESTKERGGTRFRVAAVQWLVL